MVRICRAESRNPVDRRPGSVRSAMLCADSSRGTGPHATVKSGQIARDRPSRYGKKKELLIDAPGGRNRDREVSPTGDIAGIET